MSASGLRDAAPLFAALGDETRLQLLARLGRAGPQSISDLARDVPMSRQAVTKHLQTLEAAGLADSSRYGRERMWRIRPARLGDAQRHLARISEQWDAAIERLRAMVEDQGASS